VAVRCAELSWVLLLLPLLLLPLLLLTRVLPSPVRISAI
jgi:hypothetical protein